MTKKSNKGRKFPQITGKNHYNWKFNKNKDFYRDLHKWLRYHYGNPTQCTFCKKIGKGREIHWALKKGKKLKRNINNFFPLCVYCHGEYDGTFIKKGEHRSVKTEVKKGQRLSPKTEFKKGHIPWNKGLKLK